MRTELSVLFVGAALWGLGAVGCASMSLPKAALNPYIPRRSAVNRRRLLLNGRRPDSARERLQYLEWRLRDVLVLGLVATGQIVVLGGLISLAIG